MKRKSCLCVALATVSAITVLAQTGGTPPSPPTAAQIVANRVARLTTLLSLTSSQQASATTIFTTEETALQSVRTGMRTARTALQTAVEANDPTGIGAAASTIGTLTTQEVQARATADAAFYALLVNDQPAKYKQLGPALEGPGGPGGGRGGHGGPPPPPEN